MLLQIPLKTLPNQTLTVTLNNQRFTIEIVQNSVETFTGITTSVFANVFLGQTQYYNNVKCNNLCYINQYQDAIVGKLFFASDDESEPNYTNFGTTCKLYYADYDAIEEYYQTWILKNFEMLKKYG